MKYSTHETYPLTFSLLAQLFSIHFFIRWILKYILHVHGEIIQCPSLNVFDHAYYSVNMNLDSIIFSFLLIHVFIRPAFIEAEQVTSILLDPDTSLALLQPSTAFLRPKPKIIADKLEVEKLYKKLRRKYLQNQDWSKEIS